VLDFDSRRQLFIGKNGEEAISFAADHWMHLARQAIQERGRFAVALSGGSTPKAIYQKLSLRNDLDWTKVFLFWSDERAVFPEHIDSNYHMAIEFFKKHPIPAHQIFRMKAETDIEHNAKDYEDKIWHYLGKHLFDLVMLGVGEDGHTASLFPNTHALTIEDRLVVANFIPEKKTHRMTFTFPCINQSRNIAIYALGSSKQEIVPKVLHAPIISAYPASRIGTESAKALWVLDSASAQDL
jgi:6-phosphogluconolactonase